MHSPLSELPQGVAAGLGQPFQVGGGTPKPVSPGANLNPQAFQRRLGTPQMAHHWASDRTLIWDFSTLILPGLCLHPAEELEEWDRRDTPSGLQPTYRLTEKTVEGGKSKAL